MPVFISVFGLNINPATIKGLIPIDFVLPPKAPPAQKGAAVTMSAAGKAIETSRLTSGRLWVIVQSHATSLPREKGEHYVLPAPRDENRPAGQALARHELTELEKMKLWLEADRQAMALSRKIANPDYYRVECNGLAAAHRLPLHIHIIIGRQGG